MYQFLVKHTGRNWANMLIFIWYFFLVLLIVYSLKEEQGRFRYLEW